MLLFIPNFESLASLHTLYIIVEKPKLDSIKVSRNIKIIYIKSSLQVFCVVVNCIQHKSLYDSVCVKRHITRFAHGHTNRHNFLCNSIPPNFSSKIHPHMLIFHNLSLHLYSHIPLWYLFSLLLFLIFGDKWFWVSFVATGSDSFTFLSLHNNQLYQDD